MSTTQPPAPTSDADEAAPSKLVEIVFALVALAVSATYLILGTQIELRRAAPPGQIDARFWPLVLGTLAVAASAALLVVALTRAAPTREDVERVQPGGLARIALTAVITVAYVAAWSLSSVIAFGYRFEVFPIATAVYVFVLLLVYGQRRWLGLVLYPIGVSAFIYLLFGMLLRIPL